MNTVLFEDEFVRQLEPITLTRPAYAITCGGYRLVDLLPEFGVDVRQVQGVVRPYLSDIQRLDFPQFTEGRPTQAGPTLLINARIVPSIANLQAIARIAREPCKLVADDTLVAALIPADNDVTVASSEDAKRLLSNPTIAQLPDADVSISVFEYAHDVIRFHLQCISQNVEHRLQSARYSEVADGVFAEGDVTIGEYLVTDTSQGPIVMESGATIGSHCVLKGPIVVGRNARINEHASIKDSVCLGEATRVGGEVGRTIIESYSNKQHHGYLGHAFVGSWVNLGAGTSNSNLKNTYGTVRVDYHGTRVETGMQFLGCVVGDYTKSAINTGIFTGKIIGACSTLYGFITKNVPSFANFADSFGQVTELPADVMIETQRRTFGRREVQQRECDQRLIRDMFSMTADQRRHLSGQPLSL